MGMSPALLVLILFSVALSAAAQALLKHGVGSVTLGPALPTLVAMLTTPAVILGLAFYAGGAVLWLFVLQRAQLSLAYPFVALGFVATALIGATLFGETLTLMRISGIALIIAGCIVVTQSA
jgi:multidrug transporter EmrE-like cation transporter